MDIATVEINGMDCLKRIRAIPEFENIPEYGNGTCLPGR